MNENEVLTVTLTLENNEELECEVITIFEVQGQQYIALYLFLMRPLMKMDRYIYTVSSITVMKNLVLKISKLMWNLKQFLMHLMHGQTLRTSVISTWTTWIKLIFPTIRPQSGKEGFLSRLLFSRN